MSAEESFSSEVRFDLPIVPMDSPSAPHSTFSGAIALGQQSIDRWPSETLSSVDTAVDDNLTIDQLVALLEMVRAGVGQP